ncbi:ileS [Symbiodinium natans]|uniref:isoleucine--tRNA ligase n=1 Tax=Symbiodinium natans TaxID=878477 RepID=A0A812UKV1_9DINO|nr:ileS [Symbiodinium natans]
MLADASPSIVYVTGKPAPWMPTEGPEGEPPGPGGSAWMFDGSHVVTSLSNIDLAQRGSLRVILADRSEMPARVVGTDVSVVGRRAALDMSVSRGVVYGLGQPLVLNSDRPVQSSIQTDAVVQPSNRGGPLLNSRGQVVGMAIGAAVVAVGPMEGSRISQAIPADSLRKYVQSILDTLGDNGHVSRPALGIYLEPDGFAERLGAHGVVVEEVLPGAARKAGLKAGDIIIFQGDVPIRRMDDLVTALEMYHPGDGFPLRVLRQTAGEGLGAPFSSGAYSTVDLRVVLGSSDHASPKSETCGPTNTRVFNVKVGATIGLLPGAPARAVASGKEHDNIVIAATQVRKLQDKWSTLVAQGPEGAKEALQFFSNVMYSTLTITVPPGQNVGVDIEDRTITNVNSRKLGWNAGDTIKEINGQEAKDEEQVVNDVKKAKQEGKELVFTVQRLSESPWVTIDRSLTEVYANVDSETPLMEPDQVGDMITDLKNKLNLAKDDVIPLASVKDKVDTIGQALEAFSKDVAKNHGADAVRMYMLNSGVVRAEPLKFKEEGVRDVVKDVFLPMFNAYRFLVQESYRYEGASGKKFSPASGKVKASTNHMDQWIFASMHGLIQFVRKEMEAYRLYTVVPQLVDFLEDLTNWYVRLNRDRMRGSNGLEEAFTSLSALYEVLLNVTVCLAPVVPFITEHIYQNLARALPDGHPMKAKSVHWVMIPEPDLSAINEDITQAVRRLVFIWVCENELIEVFRAFIDATSQF